MSTLTAELNEPVTADEMVVSLFDATSEAKDKLEAKTLILRCLDLETMGTPEDRSSQSSRPWPILPCIGWQPPSAFGFPASATG